MNCIELISPSTMRVDTLPEIVEYSIPVEETGRRVTDDRNPGQRVHGGDEQGRD